jgi:general secretion pathway protein D
VDLPEAEVMMEVEVLEISRNKLQQLGIRYPEGATISPTALAGDPLVLADLKAQDSTTLQVTDLPVSIDLKKNVGVSSVLASPRIRARSREKAKILIGQRVPVITTSTVLTTGGNGTSSNVQYVDVGLTLEVEPTVYMDSDVAIKINLEVSNIISSVTVGDSLAYQIGTRNASTLLRLKDGETQILAGLINDQDRRSSSRIPGLGDVPLLGRLFSTNKTDTEKTEIVLSITPRIIRTQPRPTSDNTEFYFGTESSLRSSPLAMSSSNAVAAVAAASAATTVAIAPDAAEAPAADAAADAPVETASADPADQPRERPVLTWEGPAEVKVGQEFDVSLNLSSTAELTNVRSMVRFDPAVFELQRASAGNILSADAGAAIAPVINQRSGRAQFDVTGTPVSGSGSLLNLHFKAVSPRPASMITVQQFAANGADGSAVPTIAPRPVTVVVKQ